VALEQNTWILEWDESLSVGIAAIDTEHRHFINEVNVLSRLMIARKESAEVRKMMRWIILDWNLHSRHEEELFREWQYPEADEHARIHAEISGQLHELENALDHYENEALRVAGAQLRAALLNHLIIEDMKYRDYHRTIKN
jgi:hemerythrin